MYSQSVEADFSRATNTVVVSDIHLADAEPEHPKNPLWKRFKRRDLFVDPVFEEFLEHIQEKSGDEKIELVFNGDIFDFDSVMAIPSAPEFRISWLERKRGLASEERKSRFKMEVILRDHDVWLNAMRRFLKQGHRVVFVFGNHDVELHWPSVREVLVTKLGENEEERSRIRFCEWFYISNSDTLIEHGNQYDAYSLCSNPINPLIKKGAHTYVRIPFGNLAGKYMLNGMGLFNPHAESSFIKESIGEYLVFYYRYVMRTQPVLMFTWFWSAMVTLVFSVTEGLLPAMRDPLTVPGRIQDIAKRSNGNTGMVLALRDLHAHPAIFNPFKILRELWLDRAIILALIILVSFQVYTTLGVFVTVSFWWFILPIAILTPLFIFYARSVESEVISSQAAAFKAVPTSAQITQVKRVVQGHTHLERHTDIQGVEYLNTGTWSPAFGDVQCTQPYGRKCFAWIRSRPGETSRSSELFEWVGGEARKVERA